MKSLSLAYLCFLCAAALAQPPADGQIPGERPPMQGGPPGEPRPGMMLDRWMEKLSRENPAEYERLQALQKENPDAFRDELRNRIRGEVGARLQREHPAIFQAIQGLPREDREWLVGRIQRAMEHGGPGRPDGNMENRGPAPENPAGPESDENESKNRELARSFREATDPAERDRLKSELRESLLKSFELRVTRRKAEIANFANRISDMRKMLEKREANRDAIIDRRLKELTEGDALAW